MNWGDLIAWPRDMTDCGSSSWQATAFLRSRAGGRRTSNAAGIISEAASAAMIKSDIRQS
jgi:hypothetical protein